jgi:hypothetical protein
VNRLALIEARSQAVDALLGLSVTVETVRRERPRDAAKLVASARTEALDRLATLGTCLSLARLDLGPLHDIAADVAMGVLGEAEIDAATAAVRQHPIP